MNNELERKRLEAKAEIEESQRIVGASRYLSSETKRKATELLTGIVVAVDVNTMDPDEAMMLAGRIMGTVLGEIQHEVASTARPTGAVAA